jgi:hypothetical protein
MGPKKAVVFPGQTGSLVQFVTHAEVDSEPSTSVTEKRYDGYRKGRRKAIKAF